MTRARRPARRGEMLRDLRRLSVEIGQLPLATPSVDDPAAAAIVSNLLAGTNDPAAAPSAARHQLAAGRNDLEAAASVVRHQLTGTHHGAQSDTAILPVVPHHCANRYSEIDHTARFQPYRSPAPALSRSPEVQGPIRVEDAPFSTDSLLSQGPETDELPRLDPLTDAQEIEMLQLLLADDQGQTTENDIHKSSSQQLHQTSNNLPSDSLLCWPLPTMVTITHSPSQFITWQFEHHHHSPQMQRLQAALDRNMHVAAPQPPERSAPFNSRLRSLSCAIPHPPAYSTMAAPSAVVLDVVQGAPATNSAINRMVEEPSTFDILLQQLPQADTAGHAPAHRSPNSDSTNVAASPVTARRGRGRGRGSRQPLQRRVATGGRRRNAAPNRTAAAATVDPDGEVRMAAQRQNHLWRLSERRRRVNMNRMIDTVRTLLAPAESTVKP